MQLGFFGAAQEVGRSAIMVEAEERIMLDCGLKIHDSQAYPLEPKQSPDYVVLSHAHLDHSGFAPFLFKNARPEMVCTPPTLAMSELITADSLRIMAKRGEYPYHPAHIKKMKESATLLSYKKQHELGGSSLAFYQAGHIPGAAMVDLQTGEGRVVYTGDFKGEETKTTFASELPPKEPEALIIESTYADRDHPPRKELEIELGRQIEETFENGGTVLFPAFAIGRTQELIRIIRSLDKDCDIWIEGMGLEVNEILSRFSNYMKDFKRFRHDLETCKPVTHKRMREAVLKKPGVVIATAGMLQGGPAMHYLLRMGHESKAIFTGYCVEGTNGHNLLNYGYVEYDGVKIKPKASYAYLDFSAHAGRKELFELVERMRPQKVFCVHGDKCQQFAEELKVEGFDAYAPALGETVTL
ncbi:MAG: MBL fold metallo-hydrolase [Candidatus Micrarchaeota archaeon]|nr:MBL fold metallo-hydrolase [Candidatus Micrarchaeota archaeon]